MSTRAASHLTGSLVERLLARIEAWVEGNELAALPAHELERMAHDIGLSPSDLERLADSESDATRLLYARLQSLGLTMEAIEAKGLGMRRDMERSCAFCGDRALCAHDLTERPDATDWRKVCPNNPTFEAMERLAEAAR
ncbi:MAG: hypothetical protein SFW09_09585 [Hyphomicrobiaceae bacterium]|nr:hypothetical protein [Hyphomicrobiaceae bacterium]